MPDLANLPPYKIVPCRVCGANVTVGAMTRKPPRCLMCGIQAAADQQRQMHERSGPYWDAWIAGQAARRARKSRGIPSP